MFICELRLIFRLRIISSGSWEGASGQAEGQADARYQESAALWNHDGLMMSRKQKTIIWQWSCQDRLDKSAVQENWEGGVKKGGRRWRRGRTWKHGCCGRFLSCFCLYFFCSAVGWYNQIKEQQINKNVQFRSNKNLFMWNAKFFGGPLPVGLDRFFLFNPDVFNLWLRVAQPTQLCKW